MNTESLKLELIQWILLFKDFQVLNEIQKMKENSFENAPAVQPRQFGCGKGIFTIMLQMILMKLLPVLKNICCHECVKLNW